MMKKMSKIPIKTAKSMQSVCAGTDQRSEFDIIASNEDFIKKMGQRWIAIADTCDIRKVNDSLDVCNYRVIQNYAVNKVSNFNMEDTLDICNYRRSVNNKVSNFNKSIDYDVSNPDGNGNAYFNMEDTLDICNYRRSAHNNLTDDSNDQGESTLVYHDVIAEYSLNKSTIDDKHMDELDTSIVKMEDTLDVCNYRRRSKMHSLTPIRYNSWMSSYFNKYHVPFTLFSPSPIPTTSSPIVNNSSFVAQFSDNSDDTINLSSE